MSRSYNWTFPSVTNSHEVCLALLNADGVVLVDPEYLKDRRVFGHVLAAFRYGREDLDVLGESYTLTSNEHVRALRGRVRRQVLSHFPPFSMRGRGRQTMLMVMEKWEKETSFLFSQGTFSELLMADNGGTRPQKGPLCVFQRLPSTSSRR